MTQLQAIREYLEEGNTITQIEATAICGTTRLSTHIHVLRRKHGLDIEMVEGPHTTRYGNNGTHGVYFIKDKLDERLKLKYGKELK